MVADLSSAKSDDLRYAADRARAQGQWHKALDLYAQLDNCDTNSAVLLNRAICFLALGQAIEAYALSDKAYQLQTSLWQARLVQAKAAKALGKKQEWLEITEALHGIYPDNAEIRMEYAPGVMNVYGDAVQARQLVKPLLRDPVHAESAQSLQLMTLLYDRPKTMTAKALSTHIRTFAKQFLHINDLQKKMYAKAVSDEQLRARSTQAAMTKPTGVRRVGFVSGLFCASPVYFLCIQAIRDVAAKGHQLVFFSRSTKHDWATQELKSLASEWVDCSQYDSPVLEAVLREFELDELFDMAGWTDLEVLKALSAKPAKVQLKWVGGQSCTTGMNCFDGYITDNFQTPRETFELYSEPLLSLGNHYVTYTPPPYMPTPRPRESGVNLRRIQSTGEGRLGVVANPLKLSTAFLHAVAQLLQKTPTTVSLEFIDHRYVFPKTRQRVLDALGEQHAQRLRFVTPADHPTFLGALNELDLLLDTFPYSGGLTVCEAKHLNVPIHLFPHERKLFCERHVLSHLQIK